MENSVSSHLHPGTARTPSGSSLNLLIYGASYNEVDDYVSTLRNDGLAVHATPVSDPTALEEALDAGSHDMALIHCRSAGSELPQLLAQVRGMQPLTPILLLADFSEGYLPMAANFEIRDVIPPTNLTHLSFAIRREHRRELDRREISALRAELAAAEQRCDQLVLESRDAIAYIADGMHMTVNPGYLSLFGFADAADMEGLPVMDLIAPEQRPAFKKVLRQLSDNQEVQAQATTCQTAAGEPFEAQIAFFPAQLEGEDCTQIVLRRIDQPAAVGASAPTPAPAETSPTPLQAPPEAIDDEIGNDDSRIVEGLRQALSEDRLQLDYQPIVSLQGDTREHYAVLLRLPDGERQYLPKQFLPQAEKAGLLSEIDRWVVRASIRELVQQRSEARKIHFFVNLSAASLQDENLLLWICDCLRDHDAKGAWLTFQLQAADLRADIFAAQSLIAGLRKINCKLAIANYHADPDNDVLIDSISADYIKFDPIYMTNLAKDQQQQDTLNTINEKLQEKEFRTIAVGVEAADSLSVLWNVSVNFIQGNFLQPATTEIIGEQPV